MTKYLEYKFSDSPEFISTFDEVPLWSASFGLLLLKHLELKPNIRVVDIGSGAGFPLLELAQRLGASSKCFGVDKWANANDRAKQKIRNYGAGNAEVIYGSADSLPFPDENIDLAVSNLGINNFEEPGRVFEECYRVLKRNGKLAITSNLNGHWKEFYNIFEETCRQLGTMDIIAKLKEQQERRGTVATISKMFTDCGFSITRRFEEKFEMKFLDGSAFLNHYFIKLGWLSSWKDIIPETEQVTVFTQLEINLNAYADDRGGLSLIVPMAFIEGQKV